VSFDALNVWQAIDPAVLEECRMRIPEKQRPSYMAMVMVGQSLALGVISPSPKIKLGFTDKSIEQIINMNHGALSHHQVRAALRGLNQEPLFKTIRNSTRGINGMPGRAPRRVMYLYDPCNWLRRGVVDPTLNNDESEWDNDPFSVGYDANQSGEYHTPLKHSSYTNPYTNAQKSKTKSSKGSRRRREEPEDLPF
jgi:hypothetical protein